MSIIPPYLERRFQRPFLQSALVALLAAGTPALAQVAIFASVEPGPSGPMPMLVASSAGKQVKDWHWLVEGGGSLSDHRGGPTVFYAPPSVTAPTRIRIRAQDASEPGYGAWHTLEILPAVPGPALSDPETKANPMTLFAGLLTAPAAEDACLFETIRALRFVDDPSKDMAFCHGQWLVADDLGLAQVDAAMETTRVEELQGRATALAVRPRGASTDHPRHLVFARTPPGQGSTVWTLGPDQTPSILAEAVFGPISALEMDGEGQVYVADPANRVVRVIALDGQVSTLAGASPTPGWPSLPAFRVQDGLGQFATFGKLGSGLALDPADGSLFVSDQHCIRRIGTRGEARGQVDTVLGNWGTSLALREGRSHVPVPGEPCLDSPQGLQVHGRTLYIADEGNASVRIYHLDTGELETLTGARLDPARPRAIALDPAGVCKAGLAFGLLSLAHKAPPPGPSSMPGLPHWRNHYAGDPTQTTAEVWLKQQGRVLSVPDKHRILEKAFPGMDLVTSLSGTPAPEGEWKKPSHESTDSKRGD